MRAIKDGATIAVGGFGLTGVPRNLIQAILQQGTKDLTIISNSPGAPTNGLGILYAKN